MTKHIHWLTAEENRELIARNKAEANEIASGIDDGQRPDPILQFITTDILPSFAVIGTVLGVMFLFI